MLVLDFLNYIYLYMTKVIALLNYKNLNFHYLMPIYYLFILISL